MTESHNSFLPFTRPYLSEDAIQEVVDTLRSGWITTGPRVKKFEEDLAQYVQAPSVSCVSSATAGLHLALASLNLQPGDEVITTSFTFIATHNTIVQAGGTPVPIDVNRETYNIDCDLVEKAITPKTKAIVPVHFGGAPVDLDRIYALAKHHDIRIIEDAAHAIGTEYKGKKIGSFGDTQVFSFHPNKNMTTGEGGAISTYHTNTQEFVKLARFHGINREAWNRFSKDGSQLYDVTMAGYKYNMTDISAVLGIQQLVKLEMFNKKRTIIAEEYLDKFSDIDEIVPLSYPASISIKHSWHLFVVRLNVESDMTRDMFMYKLKEKNIGTGIHFLPVHQQKYYAETLSSKNIILPNTEWNGDRILSLPLFPDMVDHDIDDVVEAIKDILK